jgi:hypothetical protein
MSDKSKVVDIGHLRAGNVVADLDAKIPCKRYRSLWTYENMRFFSPFRYPGGKSRQLQQINQYRRALACIRISHL